MVKTSCGCIARIVFKHGLHSTNQELCYFTLQVLSFWDLEWNLFINMPSACSTLWILHSGSLWLQGLKSKNGVFRSIHTTPEREKQPRAFAPTSKSSASKCLGTMISARGNLYGSSLAPVLAWVKEDLGFQNELPLIPFFEGRPYLTATSNGAVFPRHNQQHSVHAFAAQLHLNIPQNRVSRWLKISSCPKKKLENLK